MTREEYEEIYDIFDLREIAIENDLYDEYFEDLLSLDDVDSVIMDDISDYMDHNYFYDLRDKLNEIEIDSDALYRHTDTLEFIPIDEYDIDEIRDGMENTLIENGFFDDVDVEDNEEDNNGEPDVWEIADEQNKMLIALLKEE